MDQGQKLTVSMETTRDMWPLKNQPFFRIRKLEPRGQSEIGLLKRPKAKALRKAVFEETLDLWKSAPKPKDIFLPELQKEDLGDLIWVEGATPPQRAIQPCRQ